MANIKLAAVDIGILVLYFVMVVGVGIWFRKRASKNIEEYFLGGKTLPWWALGMSSAAGSFDISGTMWVVSLFYVLGMKAWWLLASFAFFIGAFLMSYLGRWLRKTNVMTAAELLKARFGNDKGGVFARTTFAVIAVIFLVFMIAIAFKGTGKFASTFLPFTPTECAIGLFIVTTLYVVLGGFTSVVITDVMQGTILAVSSIIVGIIAFTSVDPTILHANFSASLLPDWQMPDLKGTMHEGYEMFGILSLVWIISGIFMATGSAGGGGFAEQRYFASPNTVQASKTGFGHAFFYVFRYIMIASITFLAINGLVNINDPERILPTILRDILPGGIRGFVIAGFVGAFMSTFSTIVNVGASMVVRDLIQPFTRNPSQKTLVFYSYLASVGIVALGILIGFHAESINQIWAWLVVGLNGSYLIPNILRWFWWRLNSWGYAIGALLGMIVSLIVVIRPETPIYVYAPAVNIVALLGCILGSLLTEPTDKNVLVKFYRDVKPKGYWEPIRIASGLTKAELNYNLNKTSIILINVIVGSVSILVFYLTFMFLIGHWYIYSLISFIITITGAAILYKTWYKKLAFEEK